MWQYLVRSFDNSNEDTFQKELNKLGEEGWELVSLNNWEDSPYLRAVFKKPRR